MGVGASQALAADDGAAGGGCAFWSRLEWPRPGDIAEVSDSPWQQRPRGCAEEEGASLPRRGHWPMSGDMFGCHAGSGIWRVEARGAAERPPGPRTPP